jgi:hypothetical protein
LLPNLGRSPIFKKNINSDIWTYNFFNRVSFLPPPVRNNIFYEIETLGLGSPYLPPLLRKSGSTPGLLWKIYELKRMYETSLYTFLPRYETIWYETTRLWNVLHSSRLPRIRFSADLTMCWFPVHHFRCMEFKPLVIYKNSVSECIFIFRYKNVASKSFYQNKIHPFPLMLMQRNEMWYNTNLGKRMKNNFCFNF